MRRRRALVHRLSRVLHPRPFRAAALDVPFSTACTYSAAYAHGRLESWPATTEFCSRATALRGWRRSTWPRHRIALDRKPAAWQCRAGAAYPVHSNRATPGPARFLTIDLPRIAVAATASV